MFKVLLNKVMGFAGVSAKLSSGLVKAVSNAIKLILLPASCRMMSGSCVIGEGSCLSEKGSCLFGEGSCLIAWLTAEIEPDATPAFMPAHRWA